MSDVTPGSSKDIFEVKHIHTKGLEMQNKAIEIKFYIKYEQTDLPHDIRHDGDNHVFALCRSGGRGSEDT